MSDIAIRVENLGKQYRIGAKQERYNRFTEQVTDAITAPIRRAKQALQRSNVQASSRSNDTIWALRDVSFEVQRGEVVGIIGRNGAGKSTLLKILSRITEPTTGRVELHGRVSSLLEVGTGFHPELTGRENVYLNGAILGMRRDEIERKFDEIVAFSGVEKFIDTPVKRYSSGMKVRLAFAVAAHLEPEILLVDEVLAVGDAEFQSKCLGKMGEVARGGRTVLFVSHNMGAIRTLTERSVLLHNGRAAADGHTELVIQYYLEVASASPMAEAGDLPRRSPSLGSKVRVLRIQPAYGSEPGFYFREPVILEVTLLAQAELEDLKFGMTVIDMVGSPVFSVFSPSLPEAVGLGGKHLYRVEISDHRLAPGDYQIALSVFSGSESQARTVHDLVRPGASFSVLPFSRHGEPIHGWDRSYGSIVHQHCVVTPVTE